MVASDTWSASNSWSPSQTQQAGSQKFAANGHLKKTLRAKMLRIFSTPICKECSKDADIFCFIALCDFAMLITTMVLLGLEAWWTNSPPLSLGIAITVLGILSANYVVATCLAIACAYQGSFAATAGSHYHAHVPDTLRWYGTVVRHRLTYWLAYNLWLARLMAWHLRRALSRV